MRHDGEHLFPCRTIESSPTWPQDGPPRGGAAAERSVIVEVTISGTPWWVDIAIALSAGGTVAVALFGVMAWRQARAALVFSERLREDTLRPVVVPLRLEWVGAEAPPDKRQLRLQVRNDGPGSAVNFWMRVRKDGRSDEWGPAVLATNEPKDWRVAQGAEWESAYSESGATLELDYEDVFGNRFRTTARWESAAALGFSGGFFVDVRLTKHADD